MGKYDHLIADAPRPPSPDRIVRPHIAREIVWMEDSVFPGAPYFGMCWYMAPREPSPPTHTHTFDELVGFIGNDPDNPTDLGGTIRFLIGDEWYTFTRSVVIYVPAGLPHAPIIIDEVKRPIIHFSSGPNAPYKLDLVEEEKSK